MAQEVKKRDPLPFLPAPRQSDQHIPSHEELHTMKRSAEAGVSIGAVPQLSPTPIDLAERMVSLAQIRPGDTVLEPGTGTGALLDAIRHEAADSGDLTAVEINEGLTAIVKKARRVHYGDFLECNGALGKFDCIVMNPPFINASDSKHTTHVTAMLKPEGRIVVLCANGPRQDDVLSRL